MNSTRARQLWLTVTDVLWYWPVEYVLRAVDWLDWFFARVRCRLLRRHNWSCWDRCWKGRKL